MGPLYELRTEILFVDLIFVYFRKELKKRIHHENIVLDSLPEFGFLPVKSKENLRTPFQEPSVPLDHFILKKLIFSE